MHPTAVGRARAITSGMASISLTMALIAGGMTACTGSRSGVVPAETSETDVAQVQLESSGSGPGVVEGQIRGTSVRLGAAELDGDTLAIHEGDGWGFNPSLLIFLFLDKHEIAAGRTFSVRTTQGHEQASVHVHYRWRDPASGEIHAEMVSTGFDLELSIGELEGSHAPGTIVFSVPGEDTRVEGTFLAAIPSQAEASPTM